MLENRRASPRRLAPPAGLSLFLTNPSRPSHRENSSRKALTPRTDLYLGRLRTPNRKESWHFLDTLMQHGPAAGGCNGAGLPEGQSARPLVVLRGEQRACTRHGIPRGRAWGSSALGARNIQPKTRNEPGAHPSTRGLLAAPTTTVVGSSCASVRRSCQHGSQR